MKNNLHRLSKVAKELNLSVTSLSDFLISKGYKIDSDHTTKISNEQCVIARKEFKGDKKIKNYARLLQANKAERKSSSLNNKQKKKERNKIPYRAKTMPSLSKDQIFHLQSIKDEVNPQLKAGINKKHNKQNYSFDNYKSLKSEKKTKRDKKKKVRRKSYLSNYTLSEPTLTSSYTVGISVKKQGKLEPSKVYKKGHTPDWGNYGLQDD